MNSKLHILTLSLFFIFGSKANLINAQDSHSNSMTVNILPILAESSDFLSYASWRTQFSVQYEKRIGKFSPFVKITYVGPKQFFSYFTYDNNSTESYYNILGFGIGLGSKIYQNKTAEGIYISPEFDYSKSRKYKPSTDELLTFTGEYNTSLKVGKKWIYNKGFTLDIYTGIGFVFRNYQEIIEETEIPIAEYKGVGFRPYLGILIGYSF